MQDQNPFKALYVNYLPSGSEDGVAILPFGDTQSQTQGK